MFFIDALKHNVEKKFKYFVFFTRLFRGGESQEYKIKPVLFLFVLSFLAATKTLYSKQTSIVYYDVGNYNILVL